MMHNEDNTNGLWIDQSPWRLWGDGTLMDHDEEIISIEAAMKASVAQMWKAYQDPSLAFAEPAFRFPIPLDPSLNGNICPLLQRKGNSVFIRTGPLRRNGPCTTREIGLRDCPWAFGYGLAYNFDAQAYEAQYASYFSGKSSSYIQSIVATIDNNTCDQLLSSGSGVQIPSMMYLLEYLEALVTSKPKVSSRQCSALQKLWRCLSRDMKALAQNHPKMVTSVLKKLHCSLDTVKATGKCFIDKKYGMLYDGKRTPLQRGYVCLLYEKI